MRLFNLIFDHLLNIVNKFTDFISTEITHRTYCILTRKQFFRSLRRNSFLPEGIAEFINVSDSRVS